MAATEIADHGTQGPLSQAVFQGNLDQVRALLENGEDYRRWDTSGWTALHWAVFGGHLDIVRLLLNHHAECESRPDLASVSEEHIKSYNDAPLPIILAAKPQKIDLNAVEVFCELLQHLEIPEDESIVPDFNMMWKQGRLDTTRFPANMWRVLGKELLFFGIGCSIPAANGYGKKDLNNYRTDFKKWKSVLLLCAIRDSQLEVLQMLLRADTEVDFEEALGHAVFRHDTRYVQCLLDHGGDINKVTSGGRTLLHEAVMNGFLDTIIALVERGADVNFQQMEEYREGSQHLHCRLGTKGFIFLFARKGASALMQACGFLLGRNDDFPRRNPIDTTSTPEEKTMEIVQFLISKGADPTLRDALHMTALHFAVLQPHVPLVKLLIEAGASVDALDCEGRTPLHYVSRCDDNVDGKDLKDIICLLCKTRDLEFSHDLLTKPVVRPLEAYKEEKEGMRPGHIRKITLQGSHPSSDQVKDNSCTPLEIALLSSRWKVANVLMSLGAPFPTDIDLMTVMDNAIKELDVNAVELLLRNGVNAANRSLMTLIRAFIHHKKDQKRKREPAKDLETRLISILRVIIPAGADVNFTETNQGSSDEEEAEIMNREAEDGSGDDEDSDSDSSDETEPCIKDGPKVSTPMNLAASITGSQSILKELVLFGADTYGFSSHAFDPILNAAVYGDSQDLKFLLDHALSHPNESHWSRFLGNIQEGDDAVVHVCYCLEKAGALNIKNFQGRTLLHLAVEQGNEKLLRSLILHGARVDILDNQRACAMQCAASSRQAHIFATLLLAKHKTSPNSHEQTGFGKSKCKADIALLNPEANPEVMSSLVRLAPDYLLNRYLGRTTESLVYHAVQYQKDELFSILLDHNADIEAGDYHHDWRPIHMACYRGSITMVRALIDKGADIHCSTTGGQGPCIHRMGICRAKPWAGMPLHIAATSGQLEIVRTLIYHGADVNARAKSEEETSGFSTRGHGPTALDLALVTAKFDDRLDEILSKDRLRVAQLLLDSGAMVSGVVSRMSPEERARFDEFPGLWEALLAGEKALKEKENWK